MSNLLQIKNITKSHGPKLILDKASFCVAEKQKIGVIGRNGAGKSTLFNIITGQDKADSGKVSTFDKTSIGYLKQQSDFLETDTVISYLKKHSQKESWQCAKVAAMFELQGDLLNSIITELSGGFQMRVKLSLMILKEPNLLLLDEPTNYLDLRTVLLLEKFLQNYKGAFLIISHDRRFLKNTCEETLDIENGKAFHYPGKLESYLAFKKEKLLTQEKYNKKQLKKQKHLQKFIDRFGAKASLASQAKSKEKQISRLKTIDIENTIATTIINIPEGTKKKGLAFSTENLSIGYKNKTIAKNIELDIYKGEHIALLGDNGQGKSTFLKTLACQLEPTKNVLKTAKNIRIAYYAQHSANTLNPQETVESYLERQAENNFQSESIYKMAGDFLFKDDDIKKPISVLSGGEKARLCLAGIFLKTHDVLLLDEPTNHLDFETAEALAIALSESNTTIIFISHDRTFTNIISEALLEINDKQIKRISKNYEDYIHEIIKSSTSTLNVKKENTSEEKNLQRKKYEEIKRNKKNLTSIERKLDKLKKQKEEILSFFEKNPSKINPKKSAELAQIEENISLNEESWISIVDSSDKLKALD